MRKEKEIAALICGTAAILCSAVAATGAKQGIEARKNVTEAAASAVSQPVDKGAKTVLDVSKVDAKLLSVETTGMTVNALDTAVSANRAVSEIEAKLVQDKNDKAAEDAKKAEEDVIKELQAKLAYYDDDNDYPGFCGRLHIPDADIDVALYNTSLQEVCDRVDSAAVFPKTPAQGGSNLVADNDMPGLLSVGVGSTAYVITEDGEQINYVCSEAYDGYNGITGYDSITNQGGTPAWGTAELIVYTLLDDTYNVRVVCYNRA